MHMNFYKTTNPDDYGLYFYKQIGLNCTFEQPHEQIWTNPDVGTIHIYGSLDEIQCGTGIIQFRPICLQNLITNLHFFILELFMRELLILL